MNTVISIADAVTTELNGAEQGTFDMPFTAQRRVVPFHELSDLADVKVTVVPAGLVIASATRQVNQYDMKVDVAVQRKVTGDLDEAVVPLAVLVSQVIEFLKGRALAAAPYAQWIEVQNEPIYAVEHLMEKRVFTSVVRLVYRAMG